MMRHLHIIMLNQLRYAWYRNVCTYLIHLEYSNQIIVKKYSILNVKISVICKKHNILQNKICIYAVKHRQGGMILNFKTNTLGLHMQILSTTWNSWIMKLPVLSVQTNLNNYRQGITIKIKENRIKTKVW